MCDSKSEETGEISNFCPIITPLHYASAMGDVKKLMGSLKKGEDINMIQHTVHPLYVACMKGHVKIVKALIQNNCDVDATTLELQQTGLHAAVSRNFGEIVKYLAKHGALVNKQDATGATSLFLAAQYGHTGIMQNLICNRANLNISDNKGLTPLAVATLNGCIKAADLLIKNNANLDQSDQNGNTALFHAVKSGQRNICQMLTKAGATINVMNFAGEYPISIAAMYGNTIIIDDLISNRCDVNVVSSHGTPVFLAVQRQHLKALQKLINAGADVRKVDGSHRDPLVEALHQNKSNPYVVKELVSAGSSVDAKCECHEVALHPAMSKWNYSVCAYMLMSDSKVGHVRQYILDELKECCDKVYNRLKQGEQPLSLKGQCRKAIKESIGSIHYRAKVKTLQQPASLENYLLYDNIPVFQCKC